MSADRVMFTHLETGHEQWLAPPGLAEEVPVDPQKSAVPLDDSRSQLQIASGIDRHVNPHPNVTCDSCHSAVTTVRFQSLNRHNFDLCEVCIVEDSSADDWMRHEFISSGSIQQPDLPLEAACGENAEKSEMKSRDNDDAEMQ